MLHFVLKFYSDHMPCQIWFSRSSKDNDGQDSSSVEVRVSKNMTIKNFLLKQYHSYILSPH